MTNALDSFRQSIPVGIARILAIVGAALFAISPMFPWSYPHDTLDDMAFLGAPSTLQLLGGLVGLLVLISLVTPLLLSRMPKSNSAAGVLRRVAWARGARAGAWGMFAFILVVIIFITVESGALANVEWGGWIAFVGALAAAIGTWVLPGGAESTFVRLKPNAVVEIIAIALVLGAALFMVAYALNQNDGGTFVSLLALIGTLVAFAMRSGLGAWFAAAGHRHRSVLVFSAFAVAFLFPFTQNGSDANMSIATQVLVFAATAVGLNIVVGLAGLLDLGYIAFLGAGAFTAATLSESAFATSPWKPPFIVVMILAGLISASLGLLIGSPTLRVSGDYLAIVTLAFGEIFRITMNNLDGSDGPDVVHGSSGIPAIPNLELFGFDFGQPHVILGIPLGRFSNYFFLMLLIIGVIVLIFTRLNTSRIGRGWVAIREDEKAAEAMGVNVFGLKLLAFAGGAFLAGFAGAVKAHVDVSVTPDQYIFLESAFLLAAVVLGGMGTVVGVIVGATLLKLLPEKLRFMAEYRMLIFGLLLVLMMRFRPEGMIPNKRRELEFDSDDEELADEVQGDLPFDFAEEQK